MRSPARTWGSTEAERVEAYPCDRHVEPPSDDLFRAIDVSAPVPTVFRWLCQLRAAPYSYDLLDNFGRRSPRELTPGLEELAVGQRFMTIFELVEFERDEHVTLRLRRSEGVFGALAVSYVVRDAGPGRTRLLVKIASRRRPGLIPWLRRAALPWGDLVMMRKQLRTLRDLAESDPE